MIEEGYWRAKDDPACIVEAVNSETGDAAWCRFAEYPWSMWFDVEISVFLGSSEYIGKDNPCIPAQTHG